MTLEEAIKHCEKVAEQLSSEECCDECAADHWQLAEWLKELKAYKEKERAEAYPISENIIKGFEEFTELMFKRGQEESEDKDADNN